MIKKSSIDETRAYEIQNGDAQVDSIVEQHLVQIFDRYSAALDSGDDVEAEAILAEHPEIKEKFRGPLRGLYLLGRAAQEEQVTDEASIAGTRRRLGNFEIEYELGRGGMGVVYAATECSLQRRIALKILPFTAVLDPRQVARFRNEAQAAASLHHTNIVPVYSVGCERGVHYYSMQLIEGQSLEQFIKHFQMPIEGESDSPNPGVETFADVSTVETFRSLNYVNKIVEMGQHVAEAINFAHEQGIVHRDIKPSNLLLDQTGKIWVTDFGLAQCQGNANLTSHGARIGTARYMSPEQASGRNHQVDYRTDIYSLGVTLYELLTMQPAFRFSDRMELLSAIETYEPVSIRKTNPSIPVDLETVICKAMAKSPGDRYESAQDFADDLERCLEGTPVLAKRQSILDRAAKTLSKHKRIAAAGTALTAAFAIVAAVLASAFFQQHQRERIAAQNARFYLSQAHQAVNRFGGILSDELEKVPGTDEVQSKLIGEAIDYYNDFLVFAEDCPELRFDKASSHAQLASLHERTGRAELALTHYLLAIETFDQLELDPEARLERAATLNRVGIYHKRLGNVQQSLESFSSAIEEFEFLKEVTQRQEVLISLAETRANLGMLKLATGNLDEAAVLLSQSCNQLQSRDDFEDVPAMQISYFKISGNYVAVLAKTDVNKAEQVLRSSIESMENLSSNGDSEMTPQRHERMMHLADMRNNLAVLLAQQDRLVEAAELATAAVDFWHSKHAKNPFDFEIMHSFATAQNSLGEIKWRARQEDCGHDCFLAAEELLRPLVKQAGYQVESVSRLAGVLHNRSLVALRERNIEMATRLIAEAIAIQNQAIAAAPENSTYRQRLKAHQHALAIFESKDQ